MLMGVDPTHYYELQDLYFRGLIRPDNIVSAEHNPDPQWNDLDDLEPDYMDPL